MTGLTATAAVAPRPQPVSPSPNTTNNGSLQPRYEVRVRPTFVRRPRRPLAA